MNKGRKRTEHQHNTKPKHMHKLSSDKTVGSPQQSSLSTTVILRPLAPEKSRIVTDTDWEELEKNVNSLDDFNKEYSEWSRSCYSIAVSFLIFFVTLIVEHPDDFFKLWYFYIFVSVAIIALIAGVVLMSKSMSAKQRITSTKSTILNTLQRIEKKSSEINFDYSTPNDSFKL